MKLCHTEAMKLIKELEEEKSVILRTEDYSCTVSYREGETPSPSDYDYEAARKSTREIDDKIRAIRSKLAYANCTVKLDFEDADITIGEGLVLLAQLQNERRVLESLAHTRQIQRKLNMSGVVEFTECLYSVEKAMADLKEMRKKINDLQMAIDRTNLTNYIEI